MSSGKKFLDFLEEHGSTIVTEAEQALLKKRDLMKKASINSSDEEGSKKRKSGSVDSDVEGAEKRKRVTADSSSDKEIPKGVIGDSEDEHDKFPDKSKDGEGKKKGDDEEENGLSKEPDGDQNNPKQKRKRKSAESDDEDDDDVEGAPPPTRPSRSEIKPKIIPGRKKTLAKKHRGK